MTIQYDNLNSTISAVGAPANIPVNIQPKGTGGVNITSAAQNYILYSEQFQQANWVKSAATVTADATTAPNGTTTADSLVEDTSTTGGRNTYQQASVLGGGVLTFSCYLKPNGRRYVELNVWDGNTIAAGAVFDITAGTFLTNSSSGSGFTILGSSITFVGDGWYRCSVTVNRGATTFLYHRIIFNSTYPFTSYTGNGTSGVFIWGAQVEIAGSVGAYIATTTAVVAYTVPYLGFNGSNLIGLQSDGSLYVSPSGTGALQAQNTTSTAVGGNARGQNAVDWQTLRNAAARVASGSYSTITGGQQHTASGLGAFVGGGFQNTCSAYEGAIVGGSSNSTNSFQAFIGGGSANSANGVLAVAVGGSGNAASGTYNFIGGGFTNSGTALAAVTTQSATMNGTTAVTLSGSNASIRVGQAITGNFITYPNTFVTAISGTSLTLSQNASGSGTATLSFFTPFGTVVGGGNNQATGSYSFIGGGGDAGTASARNIASGSWSTVVGGWNNRATGEASFVGGGGSFGGGAFGNLSSGTSTFVGGGYANTAAGYCSTTVGGAANSTVNNFSFIGGGANNNSNGGLSAIMGGAFGTARSIVGNHVFPACDVPITGSAGISQSALLVLGVQTTDATATVLRSNASAAGTTNQVILPNNSAYFFRGEVISGVTGGGNTKGWTIEGVIKRGANAASTTLVGTPTVTSSFADAGASTWTIAVTADTTNGGLAVTFTGQLATTIRTVARITTVEMTF